MDRKNEAENVDDDGLDTDWREEMNTGTEHEKKRRKIWGKFV